MKKRINLLLIITVALLAPQTLEANELKFKEIIVSSDWQSVVKEAKVAQCDFAIFFSVYLAA